MSIHYEGDSNVGDTPGLSGVNSVGNGIGVWGQCGGSFSVGFASWLFANYTNNQGAAVVGWVEGTGSGAVGVFGESSVGSGVLGVSAGGPGVSGKSVAGSGVYGSIAGPYQAGEGAAAGVWGENIGEGIGVKGTSQGGDGVSGFSSSSAHAGVAANNNSGGFGLWASGSPAVYASGDVQVTGKLSIGGVPDVAAAIQASGLGVLLQIQRELSALQTQVNTIQNVVAQLQQAIDDLTP